MIDREVPRQDIKIVVASPPTRSPSVWAIRRMTNMVLLGALLANLPVLPVEAIEKALKEHLPERHHKLLPFNYQALREGATFLAQAVK